MMGPNQLIEKLYEQAGVPISAASLSVKLNTTTESVAEVLEVLANSKQIRQTRSSPPKYYLAQCSPVFTLVDADTYPKEFEIAGIKAKKRSPTIGFASFEYNNFVPGDAKNPHCFLEKGPKNAKGIVYTMMTMKATQLCEKYKGNKDFRLVLISKGKLLPTLQMLLSSDYGVNAFIREPPIFIR